MDGWMHACMYVCMYAYMYACMHVCMYASMHVCIYASMHLCMHACMHACMRVCMHACMHVCTYTEICLNDPSLKGFDALNDGLTIPNHILWGSTKSHAYICIYIYIYMHVYHEYSKHINVLESSSRSQLGMEN